LTLQLRIQQGDVQPHQPHPSSAPPFFPRLFRRRDKILFVEAWPDVLLRRLLKIVKFQFDALSGNKQIRFDLQ